MKSSFVRVVSAASLAASLSAFLPVGTHAMAAPEAPTSLRCQSMSQTGASAARPEPCHAAAPVRMPRPQVASWVIESGGVRLATPTEASWSAAPAVQAPSQPGHWAAQRAPVYAPSQPGHWDAQSAPVAAPSTPGYWDTQTAPVHVPSMQPAHWETVRPNVQTQGSMQTGYWKNQRRPARSAAASRYSGGGHVTRVP